MRYHAKDTMNRAPIISTGDGHARTTDMTANIAISIVTACASTDSATTPT